MKGNPTKLAIKERYIIFVVQPVNGHLKRIQNNLLNKNKIDDIGYVRTNN